MSHRFHRYTQIFLHHDFSSSDFTDESEAFLLIGLLTDFRRTLAAGQWLAPYIYSCCFLSRRFRRRRRFFFVGDYFFPQISQIYTDSGLVRSLEKNTQISQMTQFFCLDIWGIFLTIMARMNLCKSVESVGLLKRLTFSAFFNTLLPALFLPA